MTQVRQAMPTAAAWTEDSDDERRVRRAVLTGAGGFAAVLTAFWAWWPAGVALGLVAGCLAVLHLGRAMHAAALQEPAVRFGSLDGDDDLDAEFRRLRERVGDDWVPFSRAAALVTQAQWASVAGLQRELRMSTPVAQRVMGLLEREGFVGPSRGTRPRVVRVPRDRATELERLLRS
ncbi:DNA translocase FtsK [uncultured Amnibacterium sp.]|uniref:DNA translocase FtsK n=1 Tax=uncultured Amnibacterium sp. TaxID=1631851 RepID=UPI0035CA2332